MTDGADVTFAPTPEQQAVIDQPSDALVLVTAGAGSGKSSTLVRRIQHLIDDLSVPAEDILVLTFSRAAVAHLRESLRGTPGRPRVRTFDAWALEILVQCEPDREWNGVLFDDRILEATRLISEGETNHLYQDLAHVVVDEVQDLVGARRLLVQALIDQFDCGFTVVGDPAQSIYGFQIEDLSQRRAEVGEFSRWLRSTFGADLVELGMSRNFRALTEESRTVLDLGPSIAEAASAGEGLQGDRDFYEVLRSRLLGTFTLDLDDDYTAGSLPLFDGTTAVLCRTNAEVLQLSETLRDHRVAHRVRRRADDRVVPAWVSALFALSHSRTLTRRVFDGLDLERLLPDPVIRDVLWLALLSVAGDQSRRTIDLSRLAQVLREGRLPDEVVDPGDGDLVLSTFHRAKGLEFDRVVVVDPGKLFGDDEKEPGDAARALYVAMTRARSELLHTATVTDRRVHQSNVPGRVGRYGPRKFMRLGLELIGGDTYAETPAGTSGFEDDPVALQTYLATSVAPGDDVILERLFESSLEAWLSPEYLIRHEGRPVGVVSPQFRSDLYRFLQQHRRYVPKSFPRLIDRVWVDTVETVAGSPAAGENTGLGPYGVWKAPRLFGLGRFHYDRHEDGDE